MNRQAAASFTRTAARMVRRNARRERVLRLLSRARRQPVRVPEQRKAPQARTI